MSEDRWQERDTSPERIEAALREQLRERHAQDAGTVPARTLNLVVVADREYKGEIANRLDRIGPYSASRTILCFVDDRRTSIDALVVSTTQERSGGGISVLTERIELDLGARHLPLLDTIIDAIIIAEIPTVLWSPHGRDVAVEALLPVIDVILIDSDDPAHFDGPGPALNRAAELCESVSVVDLAWLRTTPWRERIAASFDAPVRLALLRDLHEFAVRHNSGSVVSGLLLSGWLASRLQLPVSAATRVDGGALRGTGGGVTFDFATVPLPVPGIAGVTVTAGADFRLSLDRAPGGLLARQADGGPDREWRVLGASRGEGGILGNAVRVATLRDPAYRPALAAAREFATT